MRNPSLISHVPSRRGSAYITVLGAAMVVATIGMGAMAVVRSQRLAVQAQADTVAARLYAESAVEWGCQIISMDSSWRTNHSSGVWYASQPFNDATITLEGIDALDGNLSNRTNDPLILKATAQRGVARQIVQATLTASGTPMDFLKTAIHTAGQLHLNSSKILTVTGAPASTNTEAKIDGSGATIAGDLQCQTLNGSVTNVTGTTTLLAPSKAMPPAGIVAMYTGLGTAISPGTTMSNVLLSPASNSYGTPNAEGVYVITTSSNMIIKNSRILGTLVISCPGKTVTVSSSVLMQRYRSDYPALIVDGNLVLANDSTINLSESTVGLNLNPSGSPYNGVTNTTSTDSYPSEIQGLVHVRGTLTLSTNSRVRGAVIVESSNSSDAVALTGNAEIDYDASLYTSPPMGYTKSVTMSIQPGSWRQVVLP